MQRIAIMGLFACGMVLACDRDEMNTAHAAANKEPVVQAAAKISKIAFIDKEHACECTRKRIDQLGPHCK